MFPFPDYYAQLGLILPKNLSYTSSVASHYDIDEETIFIIVLLLLLSIEIFLSIVQILSDWKEGKKKTSINADFIRNLYKLPIDTPSMTTQTYSTSNLTR